MSVDIKEGSDDVFLLCINLVSYSNGRTDDDFGNKVLRKVSESKVEEYKNWTKLHNGFIMHKLLPVL
jgi:hypothetical protein